MPSKATSPDPSRVQRRPSTSNWQARPHQQNSKRRRVAKDEDTDDHARKRPRTYKAHVTVLSVHSSPLPVNSQDLSKPVAQAGRRTRLLRRTVEAPQPTGREQPRAGKRCVSESKNDGQPGSYPTELETQKSLKRRRSIKEPCLLNHDAKRPKHNRVTQQSRSQLEPKNEFVEKWLSSSCLSRNSPTDGETVLRELEFNMPHQDAGVLPSPDDSLSKKSSSRKSEKTTASVNDANYRESLSHRNIYIEQNDPPSELLRRAERIISHPRASPDMDDSTAKELRDAVRRVQNEGEDEIIRQLAPNIIPAINKVPSQTLARNSNQPWFNSVPVPLDPVVLTNPLPLPKPKPDLAFGYSRTAFNREQLTTVDLLIDDQFGCSYAIPDQKLRFPFLNIEFKSQAKSGTLHVATNQAAGAGAIALNGNLELISRCFGAESFDFDEPQFFSVTMDHKFACVNVHWIRDRAEGEQYSFHLEELSAHILKDANGVRALRRAIKNILDHASDPRLQKLCDALDAYRRRIVTEREAVTADMAQTQPLPEQRRRSKRAQLPLHEQQTDQSQPDQAEKRVPANAKSVNLMGGKKNRQPRQRPVHKQRTRNQAKVQTRAMRTRRGVNATELD